MEISDVLKVRFHVDQYFKIIIVGSTNSPATAATRLLVVLLLSIGAGASEVASLLRGVDTVSVEALGRAISNTVSPQRDWVKVSPASSSVQLIHVLSVLLVSVWAMSICTWRSARPPVTPTNFLTEGACRSTDVFSFSYPFSMFCFMEAKYAFALKS